MTAPFNDPLKKKIIPGWRDKRALATQPKTQAHLVLKSENQKTGPIPVSTTESRTCPLSCPFMGAGCYASGGPLSMHWKRVSSGANAIDWQSFCKAIASLPSGQLWRHNQAGDLPGPGETIDTAELTSLVLANKGKRGFTFTHKYRTASNLKAIARANANGFTINLSANSPRHADQLLKTGAGPVVCVLPAVAQKPQKQLHKVSMANVPAPFSVTPGGTKIVVCPATTRDNVSCATCGLCQRANRDYVIGFPAHGFQTRKAEAISSRS
jgi:hypothetical protein